MSIFTKLGQAIFAGYDAMGLPRVIATSEAQTWATEVERIIDVAVAGGGFLLYTTKALLDADLAHDANAAAMVLGDSLTNDGIYSKVGASGAGSWTKVAEPFESGFVKAVDAGGTANAISVTTTLIANATKFIALPINLTNTAAPVTVSFNGATALTIKTSSGGNPVLGGLVGGTVLGGYIDGTTFRLLSDQASAAVQIACEAALDEFTDLYLGAKASDPTLDNDGDALQVGALYFNYTNTLMMTWMGTAWVTAVSSVMTSNHFTASGSASFALSTTPPAEDNVALYINGIRQHNDTWSLSTNVVTMDTIPEVGDKVFAVVTTSVSVITPVSASVITVSDVDGKIQSSNVEGALVELAPFPTVADMVASTQLSVGMVVRTLGYTAAGDGGNNTYSIVTAATGADDGGEYIDLNTLQASGLFPDNEYRASQWGAQDGMTVNASAAINAALQSKLNVVLDGKFLVREPILMDQRYMSLTGRGKARSQLKFHPPTPYANGAVMIRVEDATPANLIVDMTIRDFAVSCEYPHTVEKHGISIHDGSFVYISGLHTVDNSWATGTGGNPSTKFFVFNGRDQHRIQNCYIAADQPVHCKVNPNSAVFQVDVFSFIDCSFETIWTSNYAILIDSHVNLSQVSFKGCIALRGKGGIFYSNTNAAITASSQVMIDNFRVESGTASGGDAGGYGISLDFGTSATPCGNVTVKNSSVNDGSCNGYLFNNVSTLNLEDINCGFASGNIALSCTLVGRANIRSLGVGHNSAVVAMNSMHERYMSRFNGWVPSTNNPSIGEALYEWYTSDDPAYNHTFENGVRKWTRKEVVVDTGVVQLPDVLTADDTIRVSVTCNYGYGMWWTRGDDLKLLMAGSGGFGILTSDKVYITSTSGVVTLVNNSGFTQTFVIETVSV